MHCTATDRPLTLCLRAATRPAIPGGLVDLLRGVARETGRDASVRYLRGNAISGCERYIAGVLCSS